MWRYVKKFFLLFIDVVFDIRKVEKDRWCTMQALSEDRCSNFPCEDINGKNMASAFCSCTPGSPPPVVLPSKTYIPWMSVEKKGTHQIRSTPRQVVSLSLISVLEMVTFAIGLLPRRQCSFLQMLITSTMFFIKGAFIVSCSFYRVIQQDCKL